MCCGYVTKPTLLQDLRACLEPAITGTQYKHALQGHKGHLNSLEILHPRCPQKGLEKQQVPQYSAG